MAVWLMTIYPFYHRTLDLSHSISPSLRHGRPWLVLDKLRNKQRMPLGLSTFLLFLFPWGFTPNSAFTVSLSSFIKMMTKNPKLSHWKRGRSNEGDDNSLYLNVHTMCKIYDTKSFTFFDSWVTTITLCTRESHYFSVSQGDQFMCPRSYHQNVVEHGLSPGSLVLSMCVDIIRGEWEWFIDQDAVGTVLVSVTHFI